MSIPITVPHLDITISSIWNESEICIKVYKISSSFSSSFIVSGIFVIAGYRFKFLDCFKSSLNVILPFTNGSISACCLLDSDDFEILLFLADGTHAFYFVLSTPTRPSNAADVCLVFARFTVNQYLNFLPIQHTIIIKSIMKIINSTSVLRKIQKS